MGTIRILPVIACVAAAVIIVILLRNVKKKKRAVQYVMAYQAAGKEASVLDSLQSVQGFYKKGSAEYRCIAGAIYYLYHSNMHDYETAFRMIENVFSSREVRELHDDVLDSETNKLYLFLQGPTE